MKDIAFGEGLIVSEASIAACVNGECDSNVPGSKSMVGNRIVCIGTWENHTVPNEAPNELKRRRREYGGMVVGLPHSRGVDGVMPIETGDGSGQCTPDLNSDPGDRLLIFRRDDFTGDCYFLGHTCQKGEKRKKKNEK